MEAAVALIAILAMASIVMATGYGLRLSFAQACEDRIKAWAEASQFKLVSCRSTENWIAVWSTRRSWQEFYVIVERQDEGDTRHAYVVCGHNWISRSVTRFDVEWDD